jgi:hypothetical protein
MTSLTETLPILDEAVPALPGKLEAAAREGDAFHQAAATALDSLHEKRQGAQQLLDQVREALAALLDQSKHEHDNVEAAVQSARQAAEQETKEIEQDEQELTAAGQAAVDAFAVLEARLVQAADRTRQEHEEARAALDGLGQQVHASRPELQKAADEVDSALRAAQQAVVEGQSLVAAGVTAVTAVMDRLVAQAQSRLAQTYQRLEELRSEQEHEVGEVLQALETERGKVEQEVKSRLESEVKHALDPALDAAFDALAEMGQQVLHLQAETEAGRTAFQHELGEVGERIAPLQGGVDQVKKAARTLGVAWPGQDA